MEGAGPSGALRRLLALLFWPLIALYSFIVLVIRSVIKLPALGAGAPASAPSSTRSAVACGAMRHPKSQPLLDLLEDDEEDSESAARGRAAADDADWRCPRAQPGAFEWVGEEDLAWFKRRIAPVESRLLEGGRIGHGWQPLMDKHIPGEVRYVAYMRPLPNGTTEYLSITVAPDTTAAEMAEFFADDAERLKWDSMLHRTELVDVGRRLADQAEQIVLWHRKYPFAFLKDRWYAIARKIFAPAPGTPAHQARHYGVTKVVPSPVAEAFAADEMPGVKRIDEFYSMWASRTVPSPWPAPPGGAAAPPACETILLHHDSMKVSETLARVAIRTGMWKFLRGMVAATRPWVAARRARASPFEDDAAAVCRRTTGGADGRRARLAAIYGRAGTSARELAAAEAGGAEAVAEAAAAAEAAAEAVEPAGAPAPAKGVGFVAAALPAYHPHRHDAALLHAVATAPGELQHMAAAAPAGPPAAAADAGSGDEGAAAKRARAWAREGSSSSSLAGGSDQGDGAEGWMGAVTRRPLLRQRPAAAAGGKTAAAARPAAPAARRDGGADNSPRAPATPPLSVRLPAPPAGDAAAGALHAVLSDPGLYQPGKTCDEGTQTAAMWPGELRRRTGGVGSSGGASVGNLAASVVAGAAAGMAVLLVARVAEGSGNGGGARRRNGGGGARAVAPTPAAAAAADERGAPNFLGRRRYGVTAI